MPALIIVVNADPRVLRHTEEMLSNEGYLVVALRSVAEARKVIDSASPDLLIADLRLVADNGLELAIRIRFDHPDVPVIITHSGEDATAEADAKYYGAGFIAAPLANPRFLPCVHAALEQRRSAQMLVRRWSRTPTAGVVEVIAANEHAQILDTSNRGVRLAFSRSARIIPAMFTIALPEDVHVQARRVWTACSEVDDQCCCGAQLSVASEDPWRQFVNVLRESPAA